MLLRNSEAIYLNCLSDWLESSVVQSNAFTLTVTFSAVMK